jgi:hypothetical protein
MKTEITDRITLPMAIPSAAPWQPVRRLLGTPVGRLRERECGARDAA